MPAKSVIVHEDTLTTLPLSGVGLNRLLLPDIITSAHTSSDAIDITLEGNTAIVAFRTREAADVLLITSLNQFLVHLVPGDRPPQTLRLRTPKPDAPVASSYQTQLALLVESAYRREAPQGYQTERPGLALPIEGALHWWLTLRYKGRVLTVQEYTVYNAGALPHPLDPAELAARFPTARAISADPTLLSPSGWGRVFAIVDTDSTTLSAEGHDGR